MAARTEKAVPSAGAMERGAPSEVSPREPFSDGLPRPRPARRQRRILPGFGISTGFTMAYLGMVVLVPLAALSYKSASIPPLYFWKAATSARALASFQMSLGASLGAALVNAVFGLIIAWVLVRYRFPGSELLNALIDLPFALPTAVSGIALTTLYSSHGPLGAPLEKLGLRVAFEPLGILVALTFVGLPFVVRTVQPVLEDMDLAAEEAAAILGASRLQTLMYVVLPSVFPAVLTGFALAFGRALGEYGSVVFISGNMPFRTEIAPLLIMTKLEQFDYPGATALAVVTLVASFLTLWLINRLQSWTRVPTGAA